MEFLRNPYKSLRILRNPYESLEIIPKKEYDFNRKLNSVVRFAIYYSILLYIFKRDNNILCFPFIIVVITVFLHKTNKEETNDDALKGLMNNKSGNIDEIDMMIANNLAVAALQDFHRSMD